MREATTSDRSTGKVGLQSGIHVFGPGTRRQQAASIEDALVVHLAKEHETPAGEQRFKTILDALPSAIYTTDAVGRITHFNPACIEFSGRTPVLGTDSWCVTWKLYNADGSPLPHDQCPMAVALKEGRAVRGPRRLPSGPTARASGSRPTRLRLSADAYRSHLEPITETERRAMKPASRGRSPCATKA